MELLIPVYLNQRIVFDLVAMLQGGIATITKVSESTQDKVSSSGEAEGKFGLNKVLSSLFNIGLSGKMKGISEAEGKKSISEERIHTPASLFNSLRDELIDTEKIVIIQQDSDLKPGQLVEFSTSLKKNPIIETMDVFIQLMDLGISFEEKPKKGSGKKTTDNKNSQTKLKAFYDSLKAGDTIDITTDKLTSGHKAVITLDEKFLNDPTMSDLVDGTFKVLGKIIRVIPDESSSISLIRKTALDKLPKKNQDQVFGVFSNFLQNNDFSLPELTWEIKGPVIQIIPISIFA